MTTTSHNKNSNPRSPRGLVLVLLGPGVGAISIKATLFASVWKILCRVGDTISSTETPLVVLEAMKSEIAIRPSPEHVGKTIKAFGPGIREGSLVKAGDVLILL